MARVVVPLAAGFEEIEAVSIIDVLRRGEVEVTVASLEMPLAMTVVRKAVTVSADVIVALNCKLMSSLKKVARASRTIAQIGKTTLATKGPGLRPTHKHNTGFLPAVSGTTAMGAKCLNSFVSSVCRL